MHATQPDSQPLNGGLRRTAAHLELLAQHLHEHGRGHGRRVAILLDHELGDTLLR